MTHGLASRLIRPLLGGLGVLVVWAVISQTVAPDLPSPTKTWSESRRHVLEPFFRYRQVRPLLGGLGVLVVWAVISQTVAPDLPSPTKTWSESRRYVLEPFF